MAPRRSLSASSHQVFSELILVWRMMRSVASIGGLAADRSPSSVSTAVPRRSLRCTSSFSATSTQVRSACESFMRKATTWRRSSTVSGRFLPVASLMRRLATMEMIRKRWNSGSHFGARRKEP